MRYKYIAITLLLIEIIIAAYIHDAFIRPYVGDLLIGIFVYCLVKSFVNTPVIKTAIGVLLFCYAIEVSQYYHLVNHLGLNNSKVACAILGTWFSWGDILCYTIGISIVLVIEGIRSKHITQTL